MRAFSKPIQQLSLFVAMLILAGTANAAASPSDSAGSRIIAPLPGPAAPHPPADARKVGSCAITCAVADLKNTPPTLTINGEICAFATVSIGGAPVPVLSSDASQIEVDLTGHTGSGSCKVEVFCGGIDPSCSLDLTIAEEAWSRVGNAGTVDGVNFIGTTDDKPFNFRVNNESSGRISNLGGSATFLGFQAGKANTGSSNSAFGHTALAANTSGGSNTAVGWQALQSNTTASNNTALGKDALHLNTTGARNAAIGVGALNSNTTGSNNTAVGFNALNAKTTAGGNVAVGAYTLRSQTTGIRNVAIGESALANPTTGDYNIGIGWQALVATTGTSNVGIGRTALLANTTGTGNVALGRSALFVNTTGINNNAFGRVTLRYNTTGSNNSAFGYKAGYNLTTGSLNIDIGAETRGVAGEANAIRIGTGVSTTGGVATTKRTFIDGISGITTGLGTGNTVVIDTNGQLGTLLSSRRFKTDIQDMRDASAGLLKLRPVTFRYKQPYSDGSQPIQYGLVAEEVEEVYPDLVVHSADGQVQTVQYYKLDAMLLNEVQRLHLRAEEQAALNTDLTAELAEQRQEIQELRSRLDALAALLQRSNSAATAASRP